MEVGPVTASYVRRMSALREQAVRGGGSSSSGGGGGDGEQWRREQALLLECERLLLSRVQGTEGEPGAPTKAASPARSAAPPTHTSPPAKPARAGGNGSELRRVATLAAAKRSTSPEHAAHPAPPHLQYPVTARGADAASSRAPPPIFQPSAGSGGETREERREACEGSPSPQPGCRPPAPPPPAPQSPATPALSREGATAVAMAEAAPQESGAAAATPAPVVVAAPAPARGATPGTEQRQRVWEMQFRDPTPVRARAFADADGAASGEGEEGGPSPDGGGPEAEGPCPGPPASSPWASPTHSFPPTPPAGGGGPSLSPSALRDPHRVSPLEWGDAASPSDHGDPRDQGDRGDGGRADRALKGPRSVRFAPGVGDDGPARGGNAGESPTPAPAHPPHRAQVTLNSDGSVSIHLASPTDASPTAGGSTHAATPAATPGVRAGTATIAHPVSGTRVSVIDGTGASPTVGAQHAAAALQHTGHRGGRSWTESPRNGAPPHAHPLPWGLDPEGAGDAVQDEVDAQRIRRAGRWIPSPASGPPKWGTRPPGTTAAVTPGVSAQRLLLHQRRDATPSPASPPTTADAATDPGPPPTTTSGPDAAAETRAAPWHAAPSWDHPHQRGSEPDEWLSAAWAASDSERARAHLASAADATKRRIASLRHPVEGTAHPGSAPRGDHTKEGGDTSSRVLIARPWPKPAPSPQRPPRTEGSTTASANPILCGTRSRINPLITPGSASASPVHPQQQQWSATHTVTHSSPPVYPSARSSRSRERSPTRHLIVRNPRRILSGSFSPTS